MVLVWRAVGVSSRGRARAASSLNQVGLVPSRPSFQPFVGSDRPQDLFCSTGLLVIDEQCIIFGSRETRRVRSVPSASASRSASPKSLIRSQRDLATGQTSALLIMPQWARPTLLDTRFPDLLGLLVLDGLVLLALVLVVRTVVRERHAPDRSEMQ